MGWCLRPQETQRHQPGFQRESPQGSLRAGERASLGWKIEVVKHIRPLSTGSPTWGAFPPPLLSAKKLKNITTTDTTKK